MTKMPAVSPAVRVLRRTSLLEIALAAIMISGVTSRIPSKSVENHENQNTAELAGTNSVAIDALAIVATSAAMQKFNNLNGSEKYPSGEGRMMLAGA
jgi:hypothetical protein